MSKHETVALALRQHVNWSTTHENRMGTDRRWFCACGEMIDDEWSGEGIVARHQDHVATKILDVLADLKHTARPPHPDTMAGR